MKKLPGCQGVRKLVSISGWAKHAILYEWSTPKTFVARNPEMEVDLCGSRDLANPEMEAWTDCAFVRKLMHAPIFYGSIFSVFPNLSQHIQFQQLANY